MHNGHSQMRVVKNNSVTFCYEWLLGLRGSLWHTSTLTSSSQWSSLESGIATHSTMTMSWRACSHSSLFRYHLSNFVTFSFFSRPLRGGLRSCMHPSIHMRRTRGRSLTTGDTSSSSTWSTSSSSPSSWSTSSSALSLSPSNGRGRPLMQTVAWTRWVRS